MADETELPPEGGAEALNTPPEGENNEQQADPIEALAGEMGWVPQDQFRGAPEDWKPADEFIKTGRDINRNLSRELRTVREEVTRMGAVSSQILADKIAERDAYWQNQHRRAVEDGNHELAAQAVDEITKLKTQPVPGQPDGEPPETLQFRDRNKAWFGEGGNRLATMRAMEVAERSRLMGANVEQQLQDAEAVVRKEYPELFGRPAKQPAAVQTGQARNGGQGSGKKGFADMPAASQAMARDYEKRHGMPVEKFAESYWADQAQQRRVG